MKRFFAIAAIALAASNSFALLSETESNNTMATANPISITVPGADVGIMRLTANDTDFFKIDLKSGEYLSVMTFPAGNPTYFSPDTVLGLFDSTGSNLTYNDDAPGDSLGSSVRYLAMSDETVYIAVTGYHVGNQSLLSYYEGAIHSESGNYILTVSVVPEPASMIALGMGLAGLALRRRAKK